MVDSCRFKLSEQRQVMAGWWAHELSRRGNETREPRDSFLALPVNGESVGTTPDTC